MGSSLSNIFLHLGELQLQCSIDFSICSLNSLNIIVFLNDYMHIGFDAIDEIRGNLGGLKLPTPRQTSMEYGAYLRQPRQQQGMSNSVLVHV